MNTKKEIKTIKEMVAVFLEKDERARNSDKILTYLVFQDIARRNGKNIFIPFELFDKFPAFETIKRMRAIIQNKEKRFIPTKKEVILKRRMRQEIFSEAMLND